MFIKETRTEAVKIIKHQLEELTTLREQVKGCSPEEMYEMDKKTIVRPNTASNSATRTSYQAQSCISNLCGQVDQLRQKVLSLQNRSGHLSSHDLQVLLNGFFSNIKDLRTQDDFRDIMHPKH